MGAAAPHCRQPPRIFDAPSDAWEVFQTLAAERRRREIVPALSVLRNALLEAPATAEERMRRMHDLIELRTTWFNDVQRPDQKPLSQLMKMFAKVQRLLEVTRALKGTPNETI